MDFFEIMMFVLGAVFFIVSFLVGNSQEGETTALQAYPSEEEMEKLRQRLTSSINETAEQAITTAENRLSTMSNETILSVEDFSRQTLERIAHNHEEVVFMYHMLQTKEDDLKKTVLELENRKNTMMEPEIPLTVPEESGIEIARKKAQAAAQSKRAGNTGKTKAAAKAAAEAAPKAEAAPVDIPKPELPSEDEDSKNRKILALYKQKKSVLEISKQLGLGQGEVKLVIDLYGRL